MVQLSDLRQAVFVIALIALLGGAVSIALAEFQASDAVTAGGYADNITENGLEGIDNTTGFLGTIGTILGVMALVTIVVASFRFSQR